GRIRSRRCRDEPGAVDGGDSIPVACSGPIADARHRAHRSVFLGYTVIDCRRRGAYVAPLFARFPAIMEAHAWPPRHGMEHPPDRASSGHVPPNPGPGHVEPSDYLPIHIHPFTIAAHRSRPYRLLHSDAARDLP